MDKYEPKILEPKWQQVWADTRIYAASNDFSRPKYYMLTEFPYPSGDGLHAGHAREYTLGDVIARHKRMQGYNVLYPMGWDAFGLPTENFAIKNKIKPQDATATNTANFRRQMKALGYSFDWSREINTTDRKFYRWTQWLFLQFLKHGLAYQAEIPINWCPKEKTGLANEEVVNGLHERCGTPVEKRLLKQWMLKITAYADRLVEGLKTVDYPPRIADQQVNWIGRSEGAEIDFPVKGESRFKRVILMHGKNVTPNDKWYSWLAKHVQAAGLTYIAPILDTDDQPQLVNWTTELSQAKPDESTVLVGHCRGGVAILRWLEQAPKETRVGRVVLVATNGADKPDTAAGDFFYTGDYDFAKIKSHCNDFVVIHSRDDDWVDFKQGEHIATGLNAPLIAPDGKKHFGAKKAPEVLLQVANPSVITVFTTRPDTLGGATFLVLAPEHPAVRRITSEEFRPQVEKYIVLSQRQTELERQEEERPKTGVFTGAYAENPISHAKMPIWVADYVLASYGTGAIMGVPGHDERDFAFVQAMNAQISQQKLPVFVDTLTPPLPGQPFEERRAAMGLVKHPHEDKYLFLELKGWQTPVHGFPMGGIHDGETAVDSLVRELAEETGYDHIGAVTDLNAPYVAEFYHEYKQVNRRAIVHPVAVQLADLHQRTVKPEEKKLHKINWMTPKQIIANHHGEGSRKTFQNYLAGLLPRSIAITSVINPVIVRDDAKGYNDFVKLRKIVATVENNRGDILTINWGPKLGGRLTVGGTIEKDETPAQTAVREVIEETGYHDLQVLQVGQETVDYKYYAHSKNRACQAEVTFVHIRLLSDANKKQSLELDEEGFFKVEWVSRAQAEREITDPLHRYGLDKFIFGRPFTGVGPLTSSGPFNGLAGTEAKRAVTGWLYEHGLGRGTTKYRLRDWIFSRQHYWGEPIPVVHCDKDGVVPVPDNQLPVTLPEVEHYEPTDTGESPLKLILDWVNTTCPKCGGRAKRETDTMPNWAGSSWYWLRYADPHNDREFASQDKLQYWTPVDLYLGGMEHTTLHLLYSRFWNQFLFDQGLVTSPEPYAARRGQGIVLAPDNRKMSKSLGNVIDPSDIIKHYGADAFRLYVMFMAPYDETTPWSDERLNGVSRFVYRVWALASELIANKTPSVGESEMSTGELAVSVGRATHKTLKKVHDDLRSMRFNTLVSTLMEFVNFLNEPKTKAALTQPVNADVAQRTVRLLILMLAPAAPHITEELWHQLGEDGSVHLAPWPQYDPGLIKDDLATMVIQVNGKVRGEITAPVDADETELVNLATSMPKVQAHLNGHKIINTVFVPRRLINFVVK